jgi:hypothetical protein
LLLIPATAHALAQRVDSLSILREAHKAQTKFEHLRRHYIPAISGEDDGPCELEVGRMCYWQANNSEKPVPEPRETTRARRSLISRLARLHALSPGDDWIEGQLVRYMVESRDDSAAVQVARSCSPPRWYCHALEGYALHESERFGEAAAAYDSALAEMPADERCRWNDIALLLDDGMRDGYQRIPCGQRDSIEQRFWKLARPSFAVNGNDRQTEHFSRVLLANLSEDATNAYDLKWGSDMRELLIRYGSATWYSTAMPQPLNETPTPVGHDPVPSFHFAAEMNGDSVRWDTYARVARERYAPPYMDTVMTLDAQFAMLKRGDSALVVAIYGNPLSDSVGGKAVLGLSGTVSDSVAPDADASHIRRARAEWKGMMVAMETFDPARKSAARARQWLEPPRHARGAPEVSTLLLYSADSSAVVESLEDALRLALTDDELRGDRRLGLYWEVYGAAPDSSGPRASSRDSAVGSPVPSDDSASIQITVERTDGGIARWLGQALHLTRNDSPLTVRWHDTHPAAGVSTHSVTLDLSQLPRGTYRVSVDVGPDAEHRTAVAREIKLR